MKDKELRELDAWIAKHVFGCKPKPIRIKDGRKTIRVEYHCLCNPSHAVGWSQIFKYSTDPAAAMMVLEKCCEHNTHGNYCCVTKSLPCDSMIDKKNGHWNVGVLDGEGMHIFGTSGNAKTLPLAICLFAKKLFTKA
jgi:hypothetical protein